MSNTALIDGLSRVFSAHTTPITFGQLFTNVSDVSNKNITNILISAAQTVNGFADIIAKKMPVIKIAGKYMP